MKAIKLDPADCEILQQNEQRMNELQAEADALKSWRLCAEGTADVQA